MNLKYSVTSTTIALVMLSVVLAVPVSQDAFGQDTGMMMTATADEGSDTIMITGKTANDVTDVTLKIISPSGDKIVDFDQITPDESGEFAAEFKVGPTWTENGLYTISALQGVSQSTLYSLSMLVEVNDGMTGMIDETMNGYDSGLIRIPGTNVAKDAGITLDPVIIVEGTTTFDISGKTDRVSEDITLTVMSPMGNRVIFEQITPDIDGMFTHEVTVGPLWKEDGMYMATVTQRDDPIYTATAQIDILDGVIVPEFGTIAVMILAVAIVSIVVVSARSRLSIVPRY